MKNMRAVLRSLLLICFMAGISVTTTCAQQQHEHHKTGRVTAIKQKYISDKVHLTATQSKSFWPLYDQYEKDLAERRHSFSIKFPTRKAGFKTDDDARRYLTASLDLEQDLLRIKTKYNEQFLRVISARQLISLYDAEKDFKKILIQRLKTK